MAKWTEILSTDEKLTELANSLGVHPLALEDSKHRDQRPKLDDYETHQLLVWFMMVKGKIHELQFLIFPDQIIFVPHDPAPEGLSWR
jgi:Mg2+ and Co2+ transporter CorA